MGQLLDLQVFRSQEAQAASLGDQQHQIRHGDITTGELFNQLLFVTVACVQPGQVDQLDVHVQRSARLGRKQPAGNQDISQVRILPAALLDLAANMGQCLGSLGLIQWAVVPDVPVVIGRTTVAQRHGRGRLAHGLAAT